MTSLSRTYKRIFGVPLPREFRKAYAVLEDAVYWGVSKQDAELQELGQKRSKRAAREHWPLHEWRLLPAKGTVDKALAQIAKALQRWEGTRSP